MTEKENQLSKNIDDDVIRDFGREWQTFDQSKLTVEEQKHYFNSYFNIFPWEKISNQSKGFDAGCGTGRWAELFAPKIAELNCIDPSSAIDIAKIKLEKLSNCNFIQSKIENMPLPDKSMDFGYSIGVLHHIPDTQNAINDCTRKLKSGAPFLVYLYYAFDNKPKWFRAIWKITDFFRILISRLPHLIKIIITTLIALIIYYPIAKSSLILDKIGIDVENIPLNAYREASFYTIRTDALDRFGTKIEQRFTKMQIKEMLIKGGLENISFSDKSPYWCAVGYKKNQ